MVHSNQRGKFVHLKQGVCNTLHGIGIVVECGVGAPGCAFASVHREVGTEVYVGHAVGFPFQLEVEAHIAVAVAAGAGRIAVGLPHERLAVGSAVVAALPKVGVQTSIRLHIFLFHTEVGSAFLTVCHAVSAGVVGIPDDGELLFSFKAVHIGASVIAVRRAVTAFQLAEPSFLLVLLDGKVKHRLFVSVIYSRHPCQVALPVIRLYLINNIRRQVLHHQFAVVAEEFLAVHQNLAHGLAVPRQASVFLFHHSGQAFHQVFHH